MLLFMPHFFSNWNIFGKREKPGDLGEAPDSSLSVAMENNRFKGTFGYRQPWVKPLLLRTWSGLVGRQVCLGSKQQMSPGDTPQLSAYSEEELMGRTKQAPGAAYWSELRASLSALGSRLWSLPTGFLAKSWFSPSSPACIYQNFCFSRLLSWESWGHSPPCLIACQY